MLQHGDMLDREDKCARMFQVQTEHREDREQITGFCMKRFFWSNYLEIVSQSWNEAYDDYPAQFDVVAQELIELHAPDEESAQAKFDEFVLVYDTNGFFEINDEPSVLGLYDNLNGVVPLMSDALGNHTMGADSLEEVKARYSDFVIESKELDEFETITGYDIESRR